MRKHLPALIMMTAAVLTLGGCLTLLFGDYDYDYSSYDSEQTASEPAPVQEAPVKPAQPATVQKPPKEEPAPAVEAPSTQQEQYPETQPPQPAAAKPQAPEPQPEHESTPIAEIKPVTPEPIPLPEETAQDPVQAADTIPENEWVLLDNPISSAAELFSYVRGPWLNEFEPDREYDMVFEIRSPEALHWGITMYLRNPKTGDFEPIEFTGSGYYRREKLSTRGFKVGDLGEYYFEFYIPEHNQTYIYGKYPDYYMGFDIKADAVEYVNETDKFKWTKELVEQHLEIIPIKDTDYGEYADAVVLADETAAEWKLVARAKVLHELKYRDWTVQIDTDLEYNNGRFTGRIPLDPDKPNYYEYNQDILWRHDVLNYYFDVYIDDTRESIGGNFRIEPEAPYFTVLNEVKADYTKAEVESFLYYTPFTSPYNKKRSDWFMFMLSAPAQELEEWSYNIFRRVKGSGDELSPLYPVNKKMTSFMDINDIEDPFGQDAFAAEYGLNNWQHRAGSTSSIAGMGEPGETIEYYFVLECGVANRIYEFHKDDLLEVYITPPDVSVVGNYSLQIQPYMALSMKESDLFISVWQDPELSGIDNMVCTFWYRSSSDNKWIEGAGRRTSARQIWLDFPHKDFPAGTIIELWVDLNRGDERARIGSADSPLSFEIVEEYPERWDIPPKSRPVEY